jgi:hypothetical protein
MRHACLTILLIPFVLCRCGDGSSDGLLDAGIDGQESHDTGSQDGPQAPPDAGAEGATNPCPRTPAAADRDRSVVISHPFAGSGKKSPDFEVLTLSTSGKLSKTGQTFALGAHAGDGQIAFTPDGEVGLVALGDGTVGAFRFHSSGQVQVLHSALQTSAYASRVVMGPAGVRAYLLSSQWRENGGGVYSLKIACDGTLTEEGLVAASKLPYAVSFLDQTPDKALVVAKDILTSPPGNDVHLVSLVSKKVIAGVDAFGDDDAIVSWAALTHDRRYMLIADNAAFSATAGDRVAAVEVLTGKLRAAQVLTGFSDPSSVVTSPHDNAAIVLNAMGNQITILDYDPSDSAKPFAVRGPLAGSSKPQLPVDAVMITRGILTGRVLITENTTIRQVQFGQGGEVTEVELFRLGSGVTAIPGAIGIQP